MVTRALTPGALLQAALSRPDALTADATTALETAFEAEPAVAVAATAALLYARPDLVTPRLAARLLGYCCAAPEAETLAARQVLEALCTTPLADQGWRQLVRALRADRPAPMAGSPAVALLRAYAHWRPDLVRLDTVLTLAAVPGLAAHRSYLLDYVVGRLVYERPEAFDDAAVGRLLALFRESPGLPYVLAALAARRGTPETVRKRLGRELADRFPLRETATAILGRGPVHVLAVLNVDVGQGDELTRLTPLLQALLDTHPDLRATVITPRPYLYDTPRVHAVPIRDRKAVETALRARYEVVVDIQEPACAWVPIRPELQARVEALVEKDRPGLIVRGNVGWNHFVYQSVILDGVDRARSLGLDRALVENIYDPCLRLLAELGLHQRAGTETPPTPSLLVGSPSEEATAAWAGLAWHGRPVVLVSPFGGRAPVKGYTECQAPLLAAELTGLVREGYRVVVLPNGTPWVRPEFVAAIRAHLAPEARPMVAIAPDPAEPDPEKRLPLAERADLPYADRIMRLFKYFAAHADLICTVEGWMAHLAYNLGRPFRLILMAQSNSFDWHPHGRGCDQRLVTRLSPRGPRYEAHDLLGQDRPPPLPHRPRKTLLEQALAGLGLAGDATSAELLRHAAQSADHDIRAAALGAMARLRPLEPLRDRLLGALRDPEPLVRLRAAEAILAGGLDCRRELGPRADELLRAHCDIARQRWRAVLDLGVAALPALAVAVEGADDTIREEARAVARRILMPWVESKGRGGDAAAGPARALPT